MTFLRRAIWNVKWCQFYSIQAERNCCMHQNVLAVLHTQTVQRRFFQSTTEICNSSNHTRGNWNKTGGYVYEMVQKLHQHSSAFEKCALMSENDITDRTKYLVDSLGCSQPEIIERPKVLLLSRKEIDFRIERLHDCGHENASVPMLDLVDSALDDSQLEKAINRYLTTMGGYKSSTQFLTDKIGCNELQVMEIFKSYKKRIFTKVGKKNSKLVDILLESNITDLDSIKSNPSIFDRSLSYIEYCVRYIREQGIEKDVPLFYFILPKSQFKAAVNKFIERSLKTSYDVNHDLDRLDLSDKEKEIVRDLLNQTSTRHYTNFPKIQLLVSNGFSLQDIKNHRHVLNFSLSTLSTQLSRLQEAGMEKIHVSQIIQYISRGKISKSKLSQRLLASLMKCHISHLQSYPINVVGELNQGEQRIAENIEFLLSQGFTKADIKELPIILGHDTEILCQYWFSLPKNLNTYDLCKDHPVKLLNGLQYTIERDMNFKSLVAVKVQD